MEKKDIVRGKNFLESERILLIKLCNKYKKIIECKRSDMNFLRDKESAWHQVTIQFNAVFVGGAARTTKQLQEKYKNIKKDLRKQHAECKKYVSGTGGGPYIPPPDTKTEEEKELFETIRLSADGVTNEFDTDGRYGITGAPPHTISIEESRRTSIDLVTEESVLDDWTSASSFLWKTPKNPKLSKKTSLLTSNKILGKQTENESNTSMTLTEKEAPPSFPDLEIDNYFNTSENKFRNTEQEQDIQKQKKQTEKTNSNMNNTFAEKESPFLEFDIGCHFNSSENAEQEQETRAQNKDGENNKANDKLEDPNENKDTPNSRYVGSTNRRRPILKRKKTTVTSAGGKFELAAGKKNISYRARNVGVKNKIETNPGRTQNPNGNSKHSQG